MMASENMDVSAFSVLEVPPLLVLVNMAGRVGTWPISAGRGTSRHVYNNSSFDRMTDLYDDDR